ncbi:hypothetical protein PR202_gb16841 [Eleusine coracana subsp. coracana]|uniref:DUF1618 domain-containing protein n=1 Tax=Eleusine coracana subsp. coracana TaxID=191504 RepID=A0AAV5F1C9_ELECO|nr:hypothetical protein PR202_gb16841 [Eleusine coracana subsp. coracana]
MAADGHGSASIAITIQLPTVGAVRAPRQCGNHGLSYSTADPNTLVVARTSTGHPIGVSLRITSPPAQSRVCIHFPSGSDPGKHDNEVIATHGDSVLIRVAPDQGFHTPRDYFVYNAGDAAADSPQPPSLSLLPPCYRFLVKDSSTGILRRGEDELVVARLEIVRPNDETPKEHVAEMLLFRNCKWWTLRWPGINGIAKEKLLRHWSSRSVIPVGDDKLCWVYMGDGLIFCNMFEERPILRYVALPEDPYCSAESYSSGNVRVTAGGDAVKFVNIFARCCVAAARAPPNANNRNMPTSSEPGC